MLTKRVRSIRVNTYVVYLAMFYLKLYFIIQTT